MKHLKKMKRPQLGTILASLALIVALGGTATAASGLINGKQLKNNSVTGKKLKNKTITKNKLAPKTITALKGQKGEKGDTGVQGPKGDQGAPGINGVNGVVAPVYGESVGSINIPANTELGVTTLPVPAGKYIVTANVSITTNATDVVSCGIAANNSGGENNNTYDNNGGGRSTIPIQMVTENANVTSISLGCAAGDQVAGVSGDILAIPVQ
ncbi:MAG TPA: hypothetical protein PKD76_03400 [Solirubrobacterales bacterium]|nr:hypothetical protein [Solirubrobacterales bacterium]